MNLLILSLNPRELIDNLIAPLIHALIPNMHLRVQNPQEAESLPRQQLNRDVHDLSVGHGRVVQVELIVREHKTCIVSLCAFYAPGGIYLDNLKVT